MDSVDYHDYEQNMALLMQTMIDCNTLQERLVSLDSEVNDMKLVIMKIDVQGSENDKSITSLDKAMLKMEQHNIRCVDSINDCVSSINLFGSVMNDLGPWRDGIRAAVENLNVRIKNLNVKIKKRVKKTKFCRWKIRIKHHRQHLILLTNDEADETQSE
jgi:hypothetical protein